MLDIYLFYINDDSLMLVIHGDLNLRLLCILGSLKLMSPHLIARKIPLGF